MTMRKLPPTTIDLRARMVLLVLLPTIPITILLALYGAVLHREKTFSIFSEATTLALKIAAVPKETIPDPRLYLINLSRLPEMGAPEDCSSLLNLFNPVLKVSPYFAALAVFGPTGERICPPPQSGEYINLSDREYFQRLIRNRTYTVSKLLTGRLSKKESIIFSHPILDGQGNLKYVVNLALDAKWLKEALNDAVARVRLPDGAVALVVDDGGTIVAAAPSSYGHVGTQIADWDGVQRLLAQSQNLAREDVWPDGVRRATAYVPIFESPNGSLRMRVGIPIEPALKEVTKDNTRRVIVATSVVLLALALAWFTSARLVLRPIRTIWAAATALKRGDFSARVGDVKATGELEELAVAFNSMADQIQAERQRLQVLATHDSLTELPNRYWVRERLAQAIQASGVSGRSAGVILLDLDRFKEINDSLGHPLGDKVLVQIAKVLSTVVNGRATVGRLGGDEFVIIIEDAQNHEVFEELARTVRERVRHPIIIGEQQFLVSASLGIAVAPMHGTNVDTLLQNADVAMYRAKTEKMPGYCFYSPAMNRLASARLRIQNLLSQAVAKNELVLHYQPKIAAFSGKVTGAEALLRWNSVELGLVPPVEFIALAEQTGLIVEIGEWVLKTACDQLKHWEKDAGDEFSMAINLSPRQFADPDLVTKISSMLDHAGISAERLELEITEGALMHNPEEAICALNQLRSLGTTVSVDDFGTGYSSLEYLKRLPIDALKIDQSFVAGLPNDTCDRTIVSAVIAIAKELELRVTAEGVETESQLSTLQALGCDEFQGYHFSPPLPAAAFLTMLRRQIHRADA